MKDNNSLAYTGIYRAQVINNVDPQAYGRVQVSIPGLSGPQNATVWARPSSPFGYAPGKQGSFVVPTIGAQVYVFFENGDTSLPVYFAGVVLNNQVLPDATIDGPNPKEFVIYRSPNGNVVRVSDNKNKILLDTTNGSSITIDNSSTSITIKNAVGQSVVIDGQGNITITTPNNTNVNASNNVNINASSNTNISATSTINLDASTIAISSSTGPSVTVQNGSTTLSNGVGQAITLDNSGNITLTASNSVLIKAPNGVTISGPSEAKTF